MLDALDEQENGSQGEALCIAYFCSSETSDCGHSSVIFGPFPSAVVAISSAGVAICKKALGGQTCELASDIRK